MPNKSLCHQTERPTKTGCALIMKLRRTRKNCKTKLMGEGEL